MNSLKKKKNRYDQILEAAKSALRGIEKSGSDLERFIESEGLHIRYVDFLPNNIEAALYHDMILLKKNNNPFIEKLFILHELGHHYLHSICIGNYQADNILVRSKKKKRKHSHHWC